MCLQYTQQQNAIHNTDQLAAAAMKLRSLLLKSGTADCLQTVTDLVKRYKKYLNSHTARAQFVLTFKFRMATNKKILKLK